MKSPTHCTSSSTPWNCSGFSPAAGRLLTPDDDRVVGANFVAAIVLTWMPSFLYRKFGMSLGAALVSAVGRDIQSALAGRGVSIATASRCRRSTGCTRSSAACSAR